jgi:hypothetical protein
MNVRLKTQALKNNRLSYTFYDRQAERLELIKEKMRILSNGI